MRGFGVAMCVLLAAPAAADDLTEPQQAAYDALLPALTTAMTDQGGEAAAAFAPQLAQCTVTSARKRELGLLEDGEISEDDMLIVNKVMARAKTQRCLTKLLEAEAKAKAEESE